MSSFITELSDTLKANQFELQPALTNELRQQATNIAFDSNVTGPVSNAINRMYGDLSQNIVDNTGINNLYKQAVDNVVPRVRSGNLDELEEQTLSTNIPRGSLNPLDTLNLVAPFKNIKEGFTNLLTTNDVINLYDAFNKEYSRATSPTLENDCQSNNIENIKKSIKDSLSNEGLIIYDVSNSFNLYSQTFKNSLNQYEILYSYFESIAGIKKNIEDKLNKLNKKTDILKQNINIDDRKDKYNYNNLNFYNKVYSWVFVLYYVLFILYLFFSNFFSDKKYKEATYQFLIIIYILFPFILKFLLNYIYNAYIYLLEMFYLKNDEISYQNIIEESEHILNNYDDIITRNENTVQDLIKNQ